MIGIGEMQNLNIGMDKNILFDITTNLSHLTFVICVLKNR